MDDSGIILFSLIFMRISGCILFNPLLGRTDVPMSVKSGLIMVLSVLVYSVTNAVDLSVESAIGYSALLLKEFVAGYVLGAIFNFFIGAILFAGSVVDFQMGLSMSTIYDSQSNSSISLSANLFNIIFMLCFLTTDAHLVILRIFISSAEIVPYGSIGLGQNMSAAALDLFVQFMSLGMRLAMPMLAVQLFVEIGVGILMKAVPQINIFVVNIQAKILIGLIILLILFFPMADFLKGSIDVLIESLRSMLSVMGT